MKLFISFATNLLGSLCLGIIGLIIGATIGGNIGFPPFGSNTGYESGGVFCAIVGISLGSMLAITDTQKRHAGRPTHGTNSIVALVTAVIGLLLFDYHMPLVVGLIILLLPPIAQTINLSLQNRLKKNVT